MSRWDDDSNRKSEMEKHLARLDEGRFPSLWICREVLELNMKWDERALYANLHALIHQFNQDPSEEACKALRRGISAAHFLLEWKMRSGG